MHREVGSLMHRMQHSDQPHLCDYLLAQSCAGILFIVFYCPLTVDICKDVIVKKGKGFPYSLPSVGPGADPGVLAVILQVT